MRFWDSMKIALHNLWHNKSRTVLTAVIVFVVSLLVMMLCYLGIAFTGNMNRLYLALFDIEGTMYRLEPYSYQFGTEADHQVNGEDFGKLVEVAKRHPTVVDTVWAIQSLSGVGEYTFHPDYNRELSPDEIRNIRGSVRLEPTVYSFAFPVLAEGDYIADGRVWSAADCGTAAVWVTDTYVNQLYQTHGYALTIGQEIYLQVHLFGNQDKGLSLPVTVRGVLKSAAFLSDDYYAPLGNFFLDAEYVSGVLGSDFSAAYGCASFTPLVGRYDFGKAEKEMKAFVGEVNTAVGKGMDYKGNPKDRFQCDILNQLKTMRQISALIIGVLVFLSFIILLLSIGSVANTIVISVDKNKKFIGLMKAMGLTQRGVMQIVRKEAIVTILAGIALSTVALLLLSPPVETLLGSLLSSLVYGADGLDFVVSAPLPPYLPFATVAVFVFLALLFSKSSLSRMAKMDVIAIISEVS